MEMLSSMKFSSLAPWNFHHWLHEIFITGSMKFSSLAPWNFHHWLHEIFITGSMKFSSLAPWNFYRMLMWKWQLPVQSVMKNSSKWRHSRFRVHGSWDVMSFIFMFIQTNLLITNVIVLIWIWFSASISKKYFHHTLFITEMWCVHAMLQMAKTIGHSSVGSMSHLGRS